MKDDLFNLIQEYAPLFIFCADRDTGCAAFKDLCKLRIQNREICGILQPNGVDLSELASAGGIVQQLGPSVTASSFLMSMMRMDPEGLMMIDVEDSALPLLMRALLAGSASATVILETRRDPRLFFETFAGNSDLASLSYVLEKSRILEIEKSKSGFSVTGIRKIVVQGETFSFEDYQPSAPPPPISREQLLKEQFSYAADFPRVQGNAVFEPLDPKEWSASFSRHKLEKIGQIQFSSGRLIAASAIMDLRPFIHGDEGLLHVPKTSCAVWAGLIGSAPFREASVLSFRWEDPKENVRHSAVCLQALDWGTREDGFFTVDKQILGLFDDGSFKETLSDDAKLDEFIDTKILHTSEPVFFQRPTGLAVRTDRVLTAILEYDDNARVYAVHFVAP